MFYNPFAKKVKKSKPIIKKRIIADIHEKDSMILTELKSNQTIDLEIKSLKIGDYLIGKTIIERKTTQDFISSMLNKRLIQQLNQMQKYKQRLLIIEGDLNDLTNQQGKLNPNSIRGFILSIISNYQTPIIFTKNHQDTINYLILLAKQQKPNILMSLHSKIPKTIKEQKSYILESFPNIGPKTSEKLLKEFKSLHNIFNADESSLNKILKNKTKNFIEILKKD